MNLILIHPHEPDSAGRVCLVGERAGHILKVLKATPGKILKIGLLNGPLGRGTVEEICGKEVILRCEFEEQIPTRPAIDLLLALPRPKVMKRLWAQLAALGVGRIILTNAEKVERYYFDSRVLEPDFYTARLIEGLQQAGDTLLPEVCIVKQLKPFLETEKFPTIGNRLLADPSGAQNIFQCLDPKRSESAFGIPKEATIRERQTGGQKVPNIGKILLAVGPEGGWTPYELELFAVHGFQAFNAGSRILRSDTACVALLAQLNQLFTLAQV